MTTSALTDTVDQRIPSSIEVRSSLFDVVLALSASITVALMAASVCVAAWLISKRKRAADGVNVTDVDGNVQESAGVLL